MPAGVHKHPQYGIRIPTETLNKLKYIAEYNGRSANKEIEQLILRHIENWEDEHGDIQIPQSHE